MKTDSTHTSDGSNHQPGGGSTVTGIHSDPQQNPQQSEEKKEKATVKNISNDQKNNEAKKMEKEDMEKKAQEAKRLETKDVEKKDELHAEATRFVDALAAVEREIAAIPEGQLATINLDIGVATVTVLGCMPELRALRAGLVAKFGAADGALVDRLDLCARAASQANVDYYGTAQSTDDVAEASKRVLEARAMLLAVTQVLVQRKVVGAEVLENLRGVVGFRNQAHDLQHLVSVLRRASAAAAGVVSISPAELDLAEDAVKELVVAIGVREQGPPQLTEAADKRQRAFTLFIRTYDELRAAISHLRWREKDVESILPSLYAGRGGRKKEEDVAPPVVVSPPSPEVVTPTPEPVVVSGPVTPARPGMPGAEPFAPV